MKAGVIDIGNTRIKAVQYVDGLRGSLRFFQHEELKDCAQWMISAGVKHIISASTANDDIDLSLYLPLSVKHYALDTQDTMPIVIDYTASELGQDRLANAIAGNSLSPAASMVIDAGTCITYDWTVKGQYIGGSISPGLKMRLDAMHHFTDRLPQIDLGQDWPALIGDDTRESMLSGAANGLALEIEGIRKQFLTRYPDGHIYLTGGDTALLAPRLENDIFATPFLTLDGLHTILQYRYA